MSVTNKCELIISDLFRNRHPAGIISITLYAIQLHAKVFLVRELYFYDICRKSFC